MYYSYTEVVIIMSFVKKLWYIPGFALAVVNVLLLLFISLLKYFGKGVVFVNNIVSDAGDWVFEKAGRRDRFMSVSEATAYYREKFRR